MDIRIYTFLEDSEHQVRYPTNGTNGAGYRGIGKPQRLLVSAASQRTHPNERSFGAGLKACCGQGRWKELLLGVSGGRFRSRRFGVRACSVGLRCRS